MTAFLMLMGAGLFGLIMMAIPAFSRHGHGLGGHHAGSGPAHLPGALHGSAGHLPSPSAGHASPAPVASHAAGPVQHLGSGNTQTQGLSSSPAAPPPSFLWLIPSPRVIFGLMTLEGAFGYALMDAGHLPRLLAGLGALVPAVLIERLAVTPLWNLLMKFEGTPSSALETLLLAEAHAVTDFKNGRGIVCLVHDGRQVQMTGKLQESQASMPVNVGDTLVVEDVDPAHESVIVSVR